jgi:uncharacterized protein involved in exopolysaccharide biosynthesis
MPFADTLAVLRARWKVVAALTCLTVALALTWGTRQPKSYRATATVVVDLSPIDPNTLATHPALLEPAGLLAYLATQSDLAASAMTAKRAAQRTGLLESADMRANWLANAADQGVPYDDWLAGLLRSGLEVSMARGSPVIEFTYFSADPRAAAELANIYALSYLDVLGQWQRSQTEGSASTYARHAEQARSQLAAAWKALTAFQSRHGLLTTDALANAEVLGAYRAARQTVAQQVEATLARQASRAIAKAGSSIPNAELMSAEVLQLSEDLATYQTLLQRQRAAHGPEHPTTRAAEQALAATRGRLERARAQLPVAVESSNRQTTEQTAMLERDAAEREGQARQQATLMNESLALQHKVARASLNYQQAYVAARMLATPDDAPTYGAALLSSALAPTRAYAPSLPGIGTLALVLGLMIGTATAFLLERRDRRVYTPAALVQRLRLPILGTV